MVTKRSDPEQPKRINLTPQQMSAAVPEIRRIIAELEKIDVRTIQVRGEERFESLEEKIDALLVEIFGNDSVEYGRFRVETLDTARVHMMYEIPLYEIREGYKRGIEQAISNLRAVIELFGGIVLTFDDSPHGKALRVFENLDIHPAIKSAVAEQFRQGLFPDAVEEACKVLKAQVKTRSEKHDLSGTELIEATFEPGNPALKLSGLHGQTGGRETKGLLFLYEGAMLALRSQRVLRIIQNDPEKAVECIAFTSLLAKLLDSPTER